MQGQNMYSWSLHLSEAKLRQIVPYFAHDLPALKIAEPSDVSRPISARAVFVGRKGAGPGVKRLSSGFWNAHGKGSTRKSSRMPPRSCY